ncbi:MAG: chemotaxis protein [Eubacteriales bacterium]|nr:chemotaxis protein [Eubacteriales bacterium]
MPKGNANPQTLATEKYHKKVGLISKSFKIKKELADEFRKACEESGVSQASKISEFMREYINEVKAEKN